MTLSVNEFKNGNNLSTFTNSDIFECKREFLIDLKDDSINEEEHSVNATLVTEGKALLWDNNLLEVVEEIQLMSGAKFEDQMPLLDSHDRSSANKVIGAVRFIKVSGKSLKGKLFFAKDDIETDKIWNKVKQKMLRNVSIGFMVSQSIYLKPNTSTEILGEKYKAGTRYLRIDTMWEARESSIVALGADSGAKIKEAIGSGPGTLSKMKGSNAMTEPNNKGGDPITTFPTGNGAGQTQTQPILPVPLPVPTKEQEASIIKAYQEKCAMLKELAGDEVPEEVVKTAIDGNMSKENASVIFFDYIKNARPAPVAISVGKKLEEGFYKVLGDAIVCKSAAGKRTLSTDEIKESRPYAGVGLKEMTGIILRKQGKEVPFNDQELYEKAVSSLELNNIFGAAMNTSLKAAYEEEPSSLKAWTGVREVSNFHTQTEIQLGTMSGVKSAEDGQPLEYATLKDSSETYKLGTKALVFGITRKLFINNDLGVFARIVPGLSLALMSDLENMGYDLLGSNGGMGPTMKEDGEYLFSTAHAQPNLLWGVSDSTLSQPGMDKAFQMVRKVKAFEGKGALNLMPSSLLLPTSLAAKGSRMMFSSSIQAKENEETGNIYERLVRPLPEARLDEITNGLTAWYAVVDRINTIVRVFLSGNTSPTFRTIDAVNHLGLSWQMYFDYAIGCVDWRGIFRMMGADGP